MDGPGVQHPEAPANAQQQLAWDGEEGSYWAAHADQFDRSVAGYHGALLAAARLGPGDRVLDIGCGTGQTTRDAAARAPGGRALGVDLSGAMVAVARERAAGRPDVAFAQADVQAYPFEPESFDVAISRNGCMFFEDPVAAFGNVARALVSGGRLALAVWQPVPANEWFRAISAALAAGRTLPAPPPDAPGPFSMGDPDRVREVLGAAGFEAVDLLPVEAPMHFGDRPEDAYDLILGLLGGLLRDADEATRDRGRADLAATMRAHATPDGVLFGSAMWVVTARRT